MHVSPTPTHAAIVFAVAALLFAGSSQVSAQTAAPLGGLRINDAYAGDCAVMVALSGQRAGDFVVVSLGLGSLRLVRVQDDAQTVLEVPTVAPLQRGDDLRLSINNSEVPSARIVVKDASSRPSGVKPVGTCARPEAEALAEQEESLKASAYYGRAYDQFAPDSIGGYPPGTATVRHNRQLFGVDFDYRMFGHDSGKAQLWLTGETMHGVRNADIDCSAETNKPPICDPKAGIAYARAVLENATSLEAYVSPRIEFARLQNGTSTPTRLYATMRFGFIALDGAPRVFKDYHAGVGLKAADGPFKDSLLEVGWGNNELLSGRRWKRLKVDGTLTFDLQNLPGIGTDKARFFIEMFIDNDLHGRTPDSIQTFMGFEIDVRRFFGG